MTKSYLVLLVSCFIFLFIIGLMPLIILAAYPKMGLGGIIFFGLSLVAWIPAFFLSLGLFYFIQRKYNLSSIRKLRVVLIAFLINIIGLISFPLTYWISELIRNYR